MQTSDSPEISVNSSQVILSSRPYCKLLTATLFQRNFIYRYWNEMPHEHEGV